MMCMHPRTCGLSAELAGTCENIPSNPACRWGLLRDKQWCDCIKECLGSCDIKANSIAFSGVAVAFGVWCAFEQ